MANRNEGIAVRGLPELSRAFKAVDAGLAKELRLGFKAIAQHVIGVAQQRMPFGSGDAIGSLKPRATMKGAGIAFPGGGPDSATERTGHYPWLDFGGTTGRGHVSNGHNGYGGAIRRERITGGRYLYPAIGASREVIADEVYEVIERVAKRAQFEVRGD